MVKRTGPTNPVVRELIQTLIKKSYELDSPFLREIAEKLNKPRRQRVEVNLAHIERFTKKGDTVVVPGAVLGYGELTKPVTIAALKFSKPALEKIQKVKGKAISIRELIEINPKGTNVKILC
ncbi:MAG: 50S ribosomal protein L18e [Candidatus Aenigmarchaeota archaeon]|nr:50S ribosomal protein L18e [Candidatus Aenigmarchaeota archaeon]